MTKAEFTKQLQLDILECSHWLRFFNERETEKETLSEFRKEYIVAEKCFVEKTMPLIKAFTKEHPDEVDFALDEFLIYYGNLRTTYGGFLTKEDDNQR